MLLTELVLTLVLLKIRVVYAVEHQYEGLRRVAGTALELKELLESLHLVRHLLTDSFDVLEVSLHVQQERVEHFRRLRLDMYRLKLTQCLIAAPPQEVLLVHFKQGVLRLLRFQRVLNLLYHICSEPLRLLHLMACHLLEHLDDDVAAVFAGAAICGHIGGET